MITPIKNTEVRISQQVWCIQYDVVYLLVRIEYIILTVLCTSTVPWKSVEASAAGVGGVAARRCNFILSSSEDDGTVLYIYSSSGESTAEYTEKVSSCVARRLSSAFLHVVRTGTS